MFLYFDLCEWCWIVSRVPLLWYVWVMLYSLSCSFTLICVSDVVYSLVFLYFYLCEWCWIVSLALVNKNSKRLVSIKMKNNKYPKAGTFPKWNIKFVERGNIDAFQERKYYLNYVGVSNSMVVLAFLMKCYAWGVSLEVVHTVWEDCCTISVSSDVFRTIREDWCSRVISFHVITIVIP